MADNQGTWIRQNLPCNHPGTATINWLGYAAWTAWSPAPWTDHAPTQKATPIKPPWRENRRERRHRGLGIEGEERDNRLYQRNSGLIGFPCQLVGLHTINCRKKPLRLTLHTLFDWCAPRRGAESPTLASKNL